MIGRGEGNLPETYANVSLVEEIGGVTKETMTGPPVGRGEITRLVGA